MIVAIGYNDNQPIDVVCTILIYSISTSNSDEISKILDEIRIRLGYSEDKVWMK